MSADKNPICGQEPLRYNLLHGDCLELMTKIGDASVDLILCDLPYGQTQNQWDFIIPLPKLWAEYKRIIKESGAIVLTCAQPFTSILITSNLTMFKYEWTWIKNRGRGHLNAKKQPLRSKEDICVFYKKQCLYQPQMVPGNPYRHSGQVDNGTNYGKTYQRPPVKNEGNRHPNGLLYFDCVPQVHVIHPTQKTVELMKYLIETYTVRDQMVLDNCMGSGTTGVACVETGRKFIGIEKNELYFKMAKERIENEEIKSSAP